MIKWMKLTTVLLAAACTSTIAIAQDDAKKERQEIIIRKSGDEKEKMTIVVDGDKVTINGRPVEDIKDAEITIRQRGDSRRSPGAHFRMAPMEGQAFSEAFGPARGNRAMLGVVTESADGGAKVTDVTEESAAEKAGLKEGDVITKVESQNITSANDLIAAIGKHKPNDKVDITYKRAGKEAKTSATLGQNKPRNFTFNFDEFDFPREGAPFAQGFGMNRRPRIGLEIQDVEEGSGVVVKDVDDESPAEKAGLKEGDVITQVNGKTIAGVDEMREQIKETKEGDVVKMTYRRGKSNQTADVKIPKRLKSANL